MLHNIRLILSLLWKVAKELCKEPQIALVSSEVGRTIEIPFAPGRQSKLVTVLQGWPWYDCMLAWHVVNKFLRRDMMVRSALSALSAY